MYNNEKVKPRQVLQANTQTKSLGITTNVPMGEWQANIEYKKLNIVRSNNASYMAKKDNVGVEPTVTSGWQEVWQVVAYDGGNVVPDGNYPSMSVGQATNDGEGNNIADQFNDIKSVIPSTANENNQLADKAFVNSTVNNMSAFYITSTSSGAAFSTHLSLVNATIFYSGGKVRIPTQNDYATVLADETQTKGVDGSYPTTRYIYQTSVIGGTYPDGQWEFQYVVNNTSLTQAQVDAINSGITAEKLNNINSSLQNKINTSQISQSTGQSTTDIMSQKAVTDNLNAEITNRTNADNVLQSVINQKLDVAKIKKGNSTFKFVAGNGTKLVHTWNAPATGYLILSFSTWYGTERIIQVGIERKLSPVGSVAGTETKVNIAAIPIGTTFFGRVNAGDAINIYTTSETTWGGENTAYFSYLLLED